MVLEEYKFAIRNEFPLKADFTIFKNEIKNIRVVNLLGEEVLNTVVDPALNETSKRIDLSNLANGVSIILLSNDKGTSNFKVDLSK